MPVTNGPLAGIINSGTESATNRSAVAKSSSWSKLPGGNAAIGAFVVSLVAFTAQSEVAGYVQQSLNYKKPFLSLWLGHSGFITLLPMHLLFLRWTSGEPTSHHLHRIAQNLHWQLNHLSLSRFASRSLQDRMRHASFKGAVYRGPLEERFGFNPIKMFLVFSVLTLGITIPALSWYSAVPMTSMANITAIYNTFSVWALVFSVWFLGERWQKRKVISVLLACGGVIIVAYGGSEHRRRPLEPPSSHKPSETTSTLSSLLGPVASSSFGLHARAEAHFTNPVLGACLALLGAVTMAMYEMAFKVVGTLPDEAAQKERYSAVSSSQRRRSRSYIEYRAMPDDEEGLLQVQEPSSRDQQLCTLGDDDDEPPKAPLDTPSGERAAIWTEGDDETRTYQTIPSPARRTSPGLDESHNVLVGKGNDGEVALKKGKLSHDSVRIQEGVEVHSESETESELEEGEEEEIQRGFTRLQRTRSGANIRPAEAAANGTTTARPSRMRTISSISTQGGEWIPAPLPFGLHANLMTTGIGFVTLTVLWLGLPIAHYLGWEPFELPPDIWTAAAVFFVVFAGIIFNSTFAILLSLWGPVLASVACLVTTLLVVVADSLLGHSLSWLSVFGCVLIAAGFAVLVSAEADEQ